MRARFRRRHLAVAAPSSTEGFEEVFLLPRQLLFQRLTRICTQTEEGFTIKSASETEKDCTSANRNVTEKDAPPAPAVVLAKCASIGELGRVGMPSRSAVAGETLCNNIARNTHISSRPAPIIAVSASPDIHAFQRSGVW